MINIKEMLSEKDIKKIDDYRRYYADMARTCGNEQMADIETILQPWAKAKSQFLTRLFPEGQTIIEKDVTISQFSNEISNKIYHTLISPEHAFITKYTEYVNEYFYKRLGAPSENYWNLKSLIGQDTLADNTWKGCDFEVSYEENGATKTYKIQRGTKIMKALAKLAKIWHIDVSFEDFRIKHSQILNEAHFTGRLCLSIHPLDFMTMSDNACNWSSCMSWENEGEYHQGTIEMMNSPYVMEAYLKSSTDATLGGVKWNNKKWRELFIVHPAGIFAIKGYPYWNRELETISLEWIRDLAANVFHATYTPILMAHTDRCNSLTYIYNNTVYDFEFSTDHMYNDFCYDHAAMIVMMPNDIHEDIYYSGDSECMCCGKHGDDNQMMIFNDANICCEDCQEAHRCCICGEVLYDDRSYCDDDGNYYCEDCWNDKFTYCENCGQDVLNEDAYTIELRRYVPNRDYVEYVSSTTLCRWCFNNKFTTEKKEWLEEVTKKNEEKHNLCDDYHLYILMVDEDITLEDWEEMTDQCLRKWWQ